MLFAASCRDWISSSRRFTRSSAGIMFIIIICIIISYQLSLISYQLSVIIII